MKKFFIPLLLLALFLPLLWDYFSVLYMREYYSLFSFLMVAIAVLFYVRWKEAPVADDRPRRWCVWLLLVGAISLMPAALLYYTPWIAAIAWVVVMAAGAMQLSSYRRIDNLFGLWCLLLLFIRFPHQMDLRVMNWLEALSAKSASVVLDYLSVLHQVQASVLSLPEKEFLLDDLCNGPVSLVSTVATAAVICVVRDRRLLHTGLLLVSGLLITWLLNVVRIIAAVALYIQYDVDVLAGNLTVGFSVVAFLIALGLVLSADAFLFFLLRRTIDQSAEERELRRKLPRLAKIWNAVSGVQAGSWLAPFRTGRALPVSGKLPVVKVVLVLMILPLIGLESVILYYRFAVTQATSAALMHTDEELIVLGETSVRFDRVGWKLVDYREERRDFTSIWGMYSKIWTLKFNQNTVILALDYPFHEWHDVKACYSNLGWKAYDEQVINTSPMFSWGVSQTKLTLPSGGYGFILCSHCDQLGDTVEPKPAGHQFSMVKYRLSPKRWAPPFGASMDKDKRTFYQTQVMVSTNAPLDEASMQEIRAMYADFREQTRSAIGSASR